MSENSANNLILDQSTIPMAPSSTVISTETSTEDIIVTINNESAGLSESVGNIRTESPVQQNNKIQGPSDPTGSHDFQVGAADRNNKILKNIIRFLKMIYVISILFSFYFMFIPIPFC